MSLLSFSKKIVGKQDQKKSTRRAKEATDVTKKTVVPAAAGNIVAGHINLTPLVTEKAVGAQGASNVVVFRVSPTASKGQVATAIYERYQIRAQSIRSIRMQPKHRRRGNSAGMTNVWKKMYVTLPPGKTIDLSV